jgi:hypothetical protein
MKALISRDSHRPDQRYSGVYHNQGAMITDADLDERSGITRDRTDNLGNDAIRDGVPAVGGAVKIAANGAVSLVPGVIYADGVRGLLVPSQPLVEGAPLDLFTKQADLPFGPALPGGARIVYADIWERPVFPLEDPYLADAGLHGAVTGFRTRTMTQLKAAPLAALGEIQAGTGAFPRIGTARIAVTPLNAEILADECDPCANVVSAEQQVANALWRLEIISIEGTPNNPTSIRIAWSEENAGEIAPATGDNHEMFERANKVYEYFSPITEARAGVYANAAHARLSTFVGDLATTPTPAQDHNGQAWPFLRRWDGVATITPGTNTIANSLGGGFELSMSGGKIKLRVTAFEAVIDLTNAAVVPGDYWLVEMRRHAPEAERIRLVKETPVGILHHYCLLFQVDNGTILPLTDGQRRKLSFPPLSNLPADHVGLVNNCPKLYGDAENVQQALDQLCSISAEDIAFDPKCALYGDADNVQGALDALCDVNFSVDESFRLLFDWGVICGIVPKLAQLDTGKIAITPGSYLDRSGKVVKFKGGNFDLSTLDIGNGIEFETRQAFQAALSKGEVCLALAAKDGDTSIHLVPQANAFGPKDPSFSERLKACVEQKKIVRIDELVASLPARQKSVATKLFFASSAEGAFQGTGRLSRAEFADADAFSAKVVGAFGAVATEEETTLLKARVEQARVANPIGNATGQTAEIRQMQQATAVFTAFAETERERLERCLCELLFPPCPPALGRPPFYVPIACLRGGVEFPRLFLREVCGYCCRKQAMTWHALQYFIGDMRTRVAAQFARVCCREDDGPPPVRPGLAYDPGRFANLDLVRFVEDYKISNAFLDKRDSLPSDYVTRPKVNDLSIADAIKEMRGTGIDVAETIDVNDARAFDIIQERLTGINPEELWMSRGEVRPGDKVALVAQDGIARGYVLVERGTGRLPFEVAKAGAGAVAVAEGDLKRAEELTRLAEAAKEGFASLEKKRDDLLSDIGRLKTEAGELEKQRDATAAAVATVRDQMGELLKSRSTLAEAITAATRDLATVETNHKALLDTMRETQPVNAVLGNDKARLLAVLAGEGVTTVGDIAKLNAATIRKLEAAGVFGAGEVAALREKAAGFIGRRPG